MSIPLFFFKLSNYNLFTRCSISSRT